MIIENAEESLRESILISRHIDPGEALFFDIETTGFKASSSQLYLIGYGRRKSPGRWEITQLLAEKASEEKDLLVRFLEVVRDYKVVIHFNGNRFDLPYLEEKYAHFALPSPFSSLRTVDIYEQIRPFKSLFGLDRLNQKSVESFLDLNRKDRYNGGDLIDVYRSFKKDPSDLSALGKLMLHNYEDVKGMFALSGMLAYAGLTEAVCSQSLKSVSLKDALTAVFLLPERVPRAVRTETELYTLAVEEDSLTLTVPVLRGTLLHFFPDWKDYYYLPEEDMAIHKSVAAFVDKAYREKATPATCYIKKEGAFLPENEVLFQPVFRTSAKDKRTYFETEQLPEDPEKLTRYLRSLIEDPKAARAKKR